MTLSSLVSQWAQKSPLSIALQTPERNYTWQQLSDTVQGYGAGLAAQGVKSGDVVTLVGKNSAAMLLLFLACLERGAVTAFTMPQPVDMLKAKLDVLYRNQDASALWLSPEVVAEYTSFELNQLEQRTRRVSLQRGEASSVVLGAGRDRLASIVFTSGSTGMPKAVAHTSQQHLASAAGLLEAFSFQRDDCWLLSLPMYHVSGLAIVYRWLYRGACLKIGQGNLSEDIQGATHASLVATQLRGLLDSEQTLTLTHVLLGGSHVPLSLSQRAATIGIETWLGYGMTEAASTVTAKRIDNIVSAGRVLQLRQVMLDGQRIYIAGETLASGYYHQGALTPIREQSGWFDSRDLGEWVGDELRIIGRADNLFISGGENIHCEEIEAVLARHPQVNQVIVVPVEDEKFGARPVAIVQSDANVNELDLASWMLDKTEKFKIPDAFVAMPQLSMSGIKISRQAIKSWLSRQPGGYLVI